MNQSEIITALDALAADTTTEASVRVRAHNQYMMHVDAAEYRSEIRQNLERNARATRDDPYLKKTPKLSLEQLMSHPTATMYGSRALQVNHADSDYDIAFSSESSNIVRRLLAAGLKNTNPTDYFKVGPESGYCAFFLEGSSND